MKKLVSQKNENTNFKINLDKKRKKNKVKIGELYIVVRM